MEQLKELLFQLCGAVGTPGDEQFAAQCAKNEEKLDALIEAAVYELNQGVIPIEGIAVKEEEAK